MSGASTPEQAPTWRDRALAALPWAALAVVVTLVAVRPLAYSSSALALLSGLAPEPPIWGVLMRPWTAWSQVAEGLWWARTSAGVGLAVLTFAAVRTRDQGWIGGLVAFLLWMWPAARAALVVVGAEAWLALGTMAVVWAASTLETHPRRAAPIAGLGLAVLALAHPLGLCAAPLFVVLLAMRPPGDASRWPEQATAARPIWIAWLAALLVAAAMLRLALPEAVFLDWWKGTIDAIRAPQPPVAFAPDRWPLLGPLLGLAARTPPALLAIAAATTLGGLHRRDATSPLAWALIAWLTVIAVAGRPLPRALDPLVVVAPLVVALAGLGIRNVLASLRPATHVPAVLLVAALLAGVGAEGTQLIAGDERTSLGRIAAMVDDVDLGLPVVLDGSALSLLETIPGDVDLWPSRREGNSLGSALIRLGLLSDTVRMCPASSCGRVLLRKPGQGRIDEAWSSLTMEEASAGLWSLRVRPALAATPAPTVAPDPPPAAQEAPEAAANPSAP